MTDQATVIFHANCPDGFTGAWLMHRYLTRRGRDVILHPASYGSEPPEVIGHDVYVVDFCYEPHHLRDLHTQAWSLTILDHHATALGWVQEFYGPENVITKWDIDLAKTQELAVLDQSHSGAMLAMLWTSQHHSFVKYIQDRDLWQFKFGDNTRDVFAAVTSYDYSLENWDQISEQAISDLLVDGQAINRYRDVLIQQVINEAYQDTVLGHPDIWVAASPYAIGSDVAGELAKRDPERFAAYYVDKSPGTRRWGLRSATTGMDVARLAETRGGGGHTHASGFEMDMKVVPMRKSEHISYTCDLRAQGSSPSSQPRCLAQPCQMSGSRPEHVHPRGAGRLLAIGHRLLPRLGWPASVSRADILLPSRRGWR